VQQVTKAFATFSPVVYTQSVELDPISMEEESIFFAKVKEKKWLDVYVIQNILQLIKVYYTTQRRKTGELFYLHPISVASILLDITEDPDLIIAGLTHDVVQNTPLTQAGLSTIVGDHITQITFAAELLEKDLPPQKSDYPVYIQSIINHNNQNVILLRLADTLHNARTIYGHSPEKQTEKAKLIQRFYLPLAEQMYLTKIANELRLHISKVLD
jgi:(p)ppGpp synthase/HD superfamily hydrolase